MEAAQKKGFFKDKLAKSFSRVTKPRTTSHQQCAGSSSPSSSSISNGSSATLFTRQNSANSILKVFTYSYATTKHPMIRFHEQKTVADLPSSMQKVSIASFKPPTSFYDQNSSANVDTSGPGDENIDFKAATYISIVHERFNLC